MWINSLHPHSMIVFKGIKVYIVFLKFISIFLEGYKFVICRKCQNNKTILCYHTCTKKKQEKWWGSWHKCFIFLFYVCASVEEFCMCGRWQKYNIMFSWRAMAKRKEHHRNKIQRLMVAEGWKSLSHYHYCSKT